MPKIKYILIESEAIRRVNNLVHGSKNFSSKSSIFSKNLNKISLEKGKKKKENSLALERNHFIYLFNFSTQKAL